MPENNDYRGNDSYPQIISPSNRTLWLDIVRGVSAVHKFKKECGSSFQLICTLQVQYFDNAIIISFCSLVRAADTHDAQFAKFGQGAHQMKHDTFLRSAVKH